MFDIRPYAKAELASLYSPHVAPRSAVKTLIRWINGCPMLVEELRTLNYQPHRHSFLKPEVEAIVRHLGSRDGRFFKRSSSSRKLCKSFSEALGVVKKN